MTTFFYSFLFPVDARVDLGKSEIDAEVVEKVTD
jgi:hypothetical protein